MILTKSTKSYTKNWSNIAELFIIFAMYKVSEFYMEV